MRALISSLLLGVTLTGAAPATAAQELRFGANDTVQQVLAGQKGKRVTVRVRSGQEFTGTVRDVTGRLVRRAISGASLMVVPSPSTVLVAPRNSPPLKRASRPAYKE
jgi:hypothetical protein